MRVGTATPSLYLVLKISQVSKLQDEHNASFHMSGKSRLNPNTKLDKSSLFHPFDTFSRAAFGSHCNLFLTVRPVAHPEATPLFLQTGRPTLTSRRFLCNCRPYCDPTGRASRRHPARREHPAQVRVFSPLATTRLFRKVLQESKSPKSGCATATPSDESLNVSAHYYINPARTPATPRRETRPRAAPPAVGAEPESRLSTALPRPGRAPAPTTAT